MSDFKWGTWYPIETWVPNSYWIYTFWRVTESWDGDGVFDRPEFDFKPNPHDTHWMPPPPSPEEMAAKPSLEMAIRSRLGAYSSNLDDLRKNTGPWSLSADRMYQQHIAILRDILKEAGLE